MGFGAGPPPPGGVTGWKCVAARSAEFFFWKWPHTADLGGDPLGSSKETWYEYPIFFSFSPWTVGQKNLHNFPRLRGYGWFSNKNFDLGSFQTVQPWLWRNSILLQKKKQIKNSAGHQLLILAARQTNIGGPHEEQGRGTIQVRGWGVEPNGMPSIFSLQMDANAFSLQMGPNQKQLIIPSISCKKVQCGWETYGYGSASNTDP